jgi:hypothetical protein
MPDGSASQSVQCILNIGKGLEFARASPRHFGRKKRVEGWMHVSGRSADPRFRFVLPPHTKRWGRPLRVSSPHSNVRMARWFVATLNSPNFVSASRRLKIIQIQGTGPQITPDVSREPSACSRGVWRYGPRKSALFWVPLGCRDEIAGCIFETDTGT